MIVVAVVVLDSVGRVRSVCAHRGGAELATAWWSQLKYRFNDSLLLRIFVIVIVVGVGVGVGLVVICLSCVLPEKGRRSDVLRKRRCKR